MKNLAAIFLALVALTLVSYVDAKEVKERDLPNYKNCRVFRTYGGEFIAGHKNGVATIYQCDGDISVLEFKNGVNEKPFQIDWSQVLERDKNDFARKSVRRIYLRKGSSYVLTEYYTDWDAIEKEMEKNDSR
mgnify:FL=1